MLTLVDSLPKNDDDKRMALQYVSKNFHYHIYRLCEAFIENRPVLTV
jgi:hypothetical protein